MSFEAEKELLPEFPRTRHLPWKPNAKREDLIASEKEASVIFTSPFVYGEEKVDGANVGMTRSDGMPIIRNRSHVLRKGYSKRTAAKMQFAPIWSWYYENEDRFSKLAELGPYSVYGEWLVARHSIGYDKLPSYFLAFDLYDYDEHKFVDSAITRSTLTSLGFQMPPRLIEPGTLKKYEQIEALIQEQSAFSSERREGVYLKVCDGKFVTHRFKMVRHDFIQGDHWSDRQIEKNQLDRLP